MAGVRPWRLKTRSANRKFRNNEANNKSSRNKRWNNRAGNTFHAIVSVTAVKIQFNSPSGVFRSPNRPGTPASTVSSSSLPLAESGCRRTKSLKATDMGVVKQAVNRSAGSLGSEGNVSSAAHGASTMQSSFNGVCGFSSSSFGRGMAARKCGSKIPAPEQSRTKTAGACTTARSSYTERGMYCV